MSKVKILNDPVYGFISIPYGIIFDLVEHPYFQRLRRIKQVSLTHYVYPGALHTRFHHALGAYHLTCQAIDVLRSKGTEISDAEAEAVGISILLHDIGHGPFSHTLEHTLINVTHEQLSVMIMEQLNQEFEGALSLAIEIFNNRYHKPFLHQLVSGQLDMDRMDYLNRDSFFTGVSEGVIGYDRIIKMLDVHDGELVIEEKGIYSIEKFLIARRLMYWQVYLHKTVLSAEEMLVRVLKRAKELTSNGKKLEVSKSLQFFLEQEITREDLKNRRDEILQQFSRLDDYDIVSALKAFDYQDDEILSYLSKSLINRKLFRLELKNTPFEEEYIEKIKKLVTESDKVPSGNLEYLVFTGSQTNRAYSTAKQEIKISFKNGEVKPMSESSDYTIQANMVRKYFLCYPKIKV
ncbi:MAG: HD domain-containing protein [Saprospiraceae bacterium]|nr:HD domain-containing protein [Saprospiraceae bacterium]